MSRSLARSMWICSSWRETISAPLASSTRYSAQAAPYASRTFLRGTISGAIAFTIPICRTKNDAIATTTAAMSHLFESRRSASTSSANAAMLRKSSGTSVMYVNEAQ